MEFKPITIISLLCCLLPSICQAVVYNDHYIGFSAGSSYFKTGVTSVSDDIEYDRQDIGLALQYRKSISNEMAIEISYMDFGEVKLSGPAGQQFFFRDNTRVDFGPDALLRISAQSLGVSGFFRAWLSNSFAAGVRVGYHFWSSTLEQRGLTLRDSTEAPDWSDSDSGADLFWSLGFYYGLDSLEFGLRAETVRFDGEVLEQSDRILFSLDYGFRL